MREFNRHRSQFMQHLRHTQIVLHREKATKQQIEWKKSVDGRIVANFDRFFLGFSIRKLTLSRQIFNHFIVWGKILVWRE